LGIIIAIKGREAWGYLLSTEKFYYDNHHFSDQLGNHVKEVWKNKKTTAQDKS
jgi:hypothetical protein